MDATEILKFFVSDVITATIISGFFLIVANKKQDQARKMEDKNLQDLKDHLDLKFQIQTLEIENYIDDMKSEILKNANIM